MAGNSGLYEEADEMDLYEDAESMFSIDVDSLTIRRRGSAMALADFLRTEQPPQHIESNVTQVDLENEVGETNPVSFTNQSLSNLRQKLKKVLPQFSTNSLTREISLSPEALQSLKARLGFDWKRDPDTTPTGSSSQRGRTEERSAGSHIRHMSHERTKKNKNKVLYPATRNRSSDYVVGVGLQNYDVFRPLGQFESSGPAPQAIISSRSSASHVSAETSGSGDTGSDVTIKAPVIPTKSPLRANPSIPSPVSSTLGRALEDLHLTEPIRPEQLQFSSSLQAQYAPASSAQFSNVATGIDTTSPESSSSSSATRTPSTGRGTIFGTTPQSDLSTPVSRQARRHASRLTEKLRKTSERFLTPSSSSPSPFSRFTSSSSTPSSSRSRDDNPRAENSRAAHQIFEQQIQELRQSFNLPPRPIPHQGASCRAHPRHNFEWHTRNLWCYHCPNPSRCELCGASCCIYSSIATHISMLTAAAAPPGEPTALETEVANARAMLERITDVSSFTAREPYVTFVKCQNIDCAKTVCPSCAGKCPDPICQDVRCIECEPNRWGPCEWHVNLQEQVLSALGMG